MSRSRFWWWLPLVFTLYAGSAVAFVLSIVFTASDSLAVKVSGAMFGVSGILAVAIVVGVAWSISLED